MTIFEAKNVFDWRILVYIVFVVAPWLCYWQNIKGIKEATDINKKERKISGKVLFFICFFFSFVGLIIAIANLAWSTSIYLNTYVKYKNGEYNEVDGYVKNVYFDHDNNVRTDDIEFTVNGVDFIVYTNDTNKIWYHGSAISKEGQHVKIKYNTYRGNHSSKYNYIMEVELKDDER